MSTRNFRRMWIILAGVMAFGLMWVGGSGGTQAAQPIKVAIIQDLSGPHADSGISERYGFQLAFDEANDAGGVKGRKIEYTIGDDGANVDRGISLAKRAVDRDKVSLIIGSNVSTVSVGMIKTAVEARVPEVSGSYAAPMYQGTTPQDNGYWHFAVFGNNEDIGRYTVNLVHRAGVKKVGISYINLVFGQDLKNACKRFAANLGIQVVGEVPIESGATEVTAEVSKLKALNPEGIILIDYPGDAAAVYRALGGLDWSLPTFPMGMMIPVITKMVDPNLLNGAIFGTFADVENPEVINIVNRVEKRYKVKIAMKDYNVRAYNATLAILKAMAACKDPNSGAELRDQLEKVQPFPMCAPVPGNLGPQQWNKIPHLMFTEYCTYFMKGGKMVRK